MNARAPGKVKVQVLRDSPEGLLVFQGEADSIDRVAEDERSRIALMQVRASKLVEGAPGGFVVPPLKRATGLLILVQLGIPFAQ
jgi:hypothetical protein